MSFLVTKKAPDFNASAVLANGKIEESYSLEQLQGRYAILLFYPLDFTPT